MSLKIIHKRAEAEFTEKNSRFIGCALPLSSLDEFQIAHHKISKEYSSASHVAYAYKIKGKDGIRIKCSDDGEPSGTAGKPILNHIEGNDLINIAIFVVRYYGGKKLGAGGLIRAYGNAARIAIEAGDLKEFEDYEMLEIEIQYNAQRNLEYHLQKLKGQIIESNFGDKVQLKIKISSANKASFLEAIESEIL